MRNLLDDLEDEIDDMDTDDWDGNKTVSNLTEKAKELEQGFV